MEPTRYVRLLRKRLGVLVVCPIVAAIAAGIYSVNLPPRYEAHIVVLVRPAQPLAASDPSVFPLSVDQVASTYADMMTARPLVQSVITDLGLTSSPDDLAQSITVRLKPNTTILDVRVQDGSAAVARDVANQLVTNFIAQVKQIQQQESQLRNSRSADNLVVISPAILPAGPIPSHRTMNVAFAFGMGLLLALVAIALLESLDQSIKRDAEVTELLGLIALGHIAYAPKARSAIKELPALDTHSPISEAYRALRTSVILSTGESEIKTIVITSAAPGTGSSRTAANLAVVLAAAGHKTLLIDADLRRPSQHKIFGRGRTIGLSNLILQDGNENEAVVAIEQVPNLWLMPSGPTPPNPSELLGSWRVRELIPQVNSAFTYVVVDTPAVNAVTDAAILAAQASSTILVVEHGVTTFPALTHAKKTLDRVGANTIGVVMNKVRASGGAYTYGYGKYASANSAK